jgi:hypothetical protein
MNISKSMHNLCTNYSEIHVVTSLGVAAKKTFPISAQATKRVMIHYSVALSSYPQKGFDFQTRFLRVPQSYQRPRSTPLGFAPCAWCFTWAFQCWAYLGIILSVRFSCVILKVTCRLESTELMNEILYINH